MLDHALELASHQPGACVLVQRDRHPCELVAGRDLDWAEVMADAAPVDPFPSRPPIRSTCSTPRAPPASPRASCGTTAGTPSRCCGACATSTTSTPAMCSGPPPMWAGSSGTPTSSTARCWPAPRRCSTRESPSATPDPGAFWRVASDYGVKALFTAPTAIRAIRKEDPDGSHISRYDLSSLKYLFQAGERLDPDTYAWASEKLGIPVVDHWWQTETGWAIAANPVGVEQLPLKAGSPTVPMPGYDVQILHVDGTKCAPARRARSASACHCPGDAPDAVGRRRPVRGVVPVRASRLLPHRRRRVHRLRRLSVRDGPHRRRDQRCGTSAFDRIHRGGAGGPSRWRSAR